MKSGPVLVYAFLLVLGMMIGAFVATQLVAPSKTEEPAPVTTQTPPPPATPEPDGSSAPDIRGFALSGTIATVGTNSITLKDVIAPASEDGATQPKTREVLVDGSTKIMVLTLKDPKVYQKEIEAFREEERDPNDPGTPPSPYEEKAATFAALEAGQKVTVVADHDVSAEAKFTAETITVTYDPNATIDAGPPPGAPAPKTDSSGNEIPAERTEPKSTPPAP